MPNTSLMNDIKSFLIKKNIPITSQLVLHIVFIYIVKTEIGVKLMSREILPSGGQYEIHIKIFYVPKKAWLIINLQSRNCTTTQSQIAKQVIYFIYNIYIFNICTYMHGIY